VWRWIQEEKPERERWMSAIAHGASKLYFKNIPRLFKGLSELCLVLNRERDGESPPS
jgi:hypothetical protein